MIEHAERTVLVVDDDPEMRATIRTILEGHGYRIVEAEDGVAALRVLGQGRPDLILTDIYMPGADGLDLINALKSWPERIPIIAMSGGSQSRKVDALLVAEKWGAAAIIDKPFRAPNLLEMIDSVIAGRSAPARR